jgi:cytochrome c
MTRRALWVLGIALVLSVTPALADELPLGQRVFIRECSKCHEVGANAHNRVGPRLNGLFGRKAGSLADYKYYSEANKAAGFVWTPENLAQFLPNPKSMLQGSTQIYPGLKNEREIKALIEYLATQ